ncbi:MAG: aryl-sulfate sulfotransferase [Planctomycetota bacterium]
MRVTTDCGIENRPGSNGGFAGPVGVPVTEMPENVAEQVAGGWGREQVETDWDRVAPGYVLIDADALKASYLVGTDKEIAASFSGDHYPKYTQILPNGNRLVSTNARAVGIVRGGGGKTGCMEEYDADGNLLWRVSLNDVDYMSHHAIVKLPNGNVLAQVWEVATADEAIALGLDPEKAPENGEFWFEGIVEVDPYAVEIVWEWSIRHHLVQDFDIGRSNYGVVAEHPELLDINLNQPDDGTADHDWTHGNSIDYDPELDQILLSIREMNEVVVIDHSTTPFEAARHSGGRYGMGGDFLYRWGNPQNYGHGTAEDRQLLLQHDARWIPAGLPGAGNIMVFNNGDPDIRPWTTIVEFTPPVRADGTFVREEGEAFGPKELAWEYDPEPADRFYSAFISGAHRLGNGNTFINAGRIGHQREVTPEGDIVWEYAFTNESNAPHIMWRATKYPADYPGLAGLISQDEKPAQ